jgi:hypothetical protein
MKRLVFAVGVLALGAAALTPARADFAVIRFKDGHCQAWMDVGLKSWDVAAMHGKWAMKHHRCKAWS